MAWMKVVYVDTGRKCVVSANTQKVDFVKGHARFASGGAKYEVAVKYIVTIEPAE